MAKKNLASLMNGIMGEEPKSDNQPIASGLQVKDGEPDSPKKVGRPRKNSNDTITSIQIDKNKLRKIKYISFFSDCMLKDVIDKALSDYLDRWETENGTIVLPDVKKI